MEVETGGVRQLVVQSDLHNIVLADHEARPGQLTIEGVDWSETTVSESAGLVSGLVLGSQAELTSLGGSTTRSVTRVETADRTGSSQGPGTRGNHQDREVLSYSEGLLT